MLSPARLSPSTGLPWARPENNIAALSALFGDGRPRFRMSSFDSILMRPRESTPHSIEPSWAANLSSSGSMSISPFSKTCRRFQKSSARALTNRSLSLWRLSPVVRSNWQAELDETINYSSADARDVDYCSNPGVLVLVGVDVRIALTMWPVVAMVSALWCALKVLTQPPSRRTITVSFSP